MKSNRGGMCINGCAGVGQYFKGCMQAHCCFLQTFSQMVMTCFSFKYLVYPKNLLSSGYQEGHLPLGLMFCRKKRHYMISKMLHNCVKLLGICWQCKLTAHYSEHRVPFWYQPAGTQTDQRYTHGWQIKASYASVTHAWSPVDGPPKKCLVAYKLLQSNIIT